MMPMRHPLRNNTSVVPEMIAVFLKTQIADADGVLLFTPEYNNAIPGMFKNAIDWTSRPANDIARVFAGKPVAVLGASPGGFGTILAQDAWLARYRCDLSGRAGWLKSHGLRRPQERGRGQGWSLGPLCAGMRRGQFPVLFTRA
ncbi:NAD(P)H-dependent oxidoreductase [Oceaniovalibus sp. ACAM 378]|nr:NAD(P)H-dependent oxidoreductase [Oceaniovalibus sp. ACAM 378]